MLALETGSRQRWAEASGQGAVEWRELPLQQTDNGHAVIGAEATGRRLRAETGSRGAPETPQLLTVHFNSHGGG